MVALETPDCNFGWKAPDFSLLATDGKNYGISDFSGSKAFVVMFICNHCPFVKSIIDRVVRDIADLEDYGVSAVAICSNDYVAYPEDSFDNMKIFARENNFGFPYLHDSSQEVAKDYGAVCTPDFFGFNGNKELCYRGRFDSSGMNARTDTDTRDLYNAMVYIAHNQKAPEKQLRSIGCSLKWKDS